jgi:phage/plasmid-like protein (TIGR03299 family)
MSADLETYQEMAAFASLRQPGWHGLGTVFPEPVSTDEMLDISHLSRWNVRLIDVSEGFGDINFDAISPYLTVRDNPFVNGQVDALGVVGERYNVFQNEELFDFGDHLLAGGGRWETAGSIRNGRQVFASAEFGDDTVVLDPNGRADQIKVYLVLTTSHDGSVSITAAVSPFRPQCANQLAMALSHAHRTYKFRHTQTAQGRVQDARNALGVQVAYMDEFSREANALIQQEVNAQKFYEIVSKVYPQPDEDASSKAQTRYLNKIETIEDIYNQPHNENIRGTAWGVLNALGERLDWHRSPRAGNVEGRYLAASGMDPVTNAAKSNILNVVKEVVFA